MEAELQIVDNTEKQRFETRVDGQLCVLEYRLIDGTLNIDHVGVPPPVEGRGIADALTEAALQSARQHKLGVVPICPYVVAWLRRHPEYAGLIQS